MSYFKDGDYVALIDNEYSVYDILEDVLGGVKTDKSRNIGKVIGNHNNCYKVQYGGEAKVGNYDPLSIGHIAVYLYALSQNKTGCLGSNTKKAGIIIDWDNYCKGNNITVQTAGPTGLPITSVYSPNDLIFEVRDPKSGRIPPEYSLPSSGGGKKRTTVRRNRIQRYFTRVIKRV